MLKISSILSEGKDEKIVGLRERLECGGVGKGFEEILIRRLDKVSGGV